MVGYIWSNVLLASLKPLVDSKTFTDHHQRRRLADRRRAVLALRVLDLLEQRPDAAGGRPLHEPEGREDRVPDRRRTTPPARTCSEGVSATFKGQIVGRELTRWPDQLDFSAELSKARAAKPDAIFAFYPGGAGIQFVTQYAQSGLKGQIPLYTAFTIDELSLPRLKDLARRHSRRAAVGQRSAERRQQEVRRRLQGEVQDLTRRSTARRPTTRSSLHRQRGSRRPRATSSKKDELRKAIEKADFKSVRGNFKFGHNHIPIQNFYLQDVVKEGDDYVLKTVATIVENDQDKHVGKCPMK